MKKSLRRLACILALATLAATLFGCSGGAKTTGGPTGAEVTTQSPSPADAATASNEKVTLNVTVSTANDDGDVKDMWLFKWLPNYTGVNLNVTGITKDAWQGRKNLIMSGGDLADLYWGFNWTTTELYDYGQQKIFQPLNEYIDAYGDKLKVIDDYIGHDKFLGAATAPDGNIYGLPCMTEPAPDMLNRTTYGMGINTAMLQAAGQSMPKTLEDLYNVLKAISDTGKNGKMSAQYDGEFRSLTLAAYQIATDGDVANNIALKQAEKGKWQTIFIPYDPSYKEWLTMMNKFYSGGMIDESFFTAKATTRAAENQKDPAAVIQSSFEASIGEFPDIYKQYQVFLLNESTTLDAITYNTNHAAMGGFVVTNKCAHPDAAVKFCNFLYDPATMLTTAWGPNVDNPQQYDENAKAIGAGYKVVYKEDGKTYNHNDYFFDKAKYASFNDFRKALIAPSQIYNNFYPISGLYARVKIYNAQPRNVGDKEASALAYFRLQQQENIPNIAYRYPDVYLDIDTYNRAIQLRSELEDYVYQMEGKFISGDLSIADNYGAFVEKLKSLGVEEYIGIYDKAYKQRIGN